MSAYFASLDADYEGEGACLDCGTSTFEGEELCPACYDAEQARDRAEDEALDPESATAPEYMKPYSDDDGPEPLADRCEGCGRYGDGECCLDETEASPSYSDSNYAAGLAILAGLPDGGPAINAGLHTDDLEVTVTKIVTCGGCEQPPTLCTCGPLAQPEAALCERLEHSKIESTILETRIEARTHFGYDAQRFPLVSPRVLNVQDEQKALDLDSYFEAVTSQAPWTPSSERKISSLEFKIKNGECVCDAYPAQHRIDALREELAECSPDYASYYQVKADRLALLEAGVGDCGPTARALAGFDVVLASLSRDIIRSFQINGELTGWLKRRTAWQNEFCPVAAEPTFDGLGTPAQDVNYGLHLADSYLDDEGFAATHSLDPARDIERATLDARATLDQLHFDAASDEWAQGHYEGEARRRASALRARREEFEALLAQEASKKGYVSGDAGDEAYQAMRLAWYTRLNERIAAKGGDELRGYASACWLIRSKRGDAPTFTQDVKVIHGEVGAPTSKVKCSGLPKQNKGEAYKPTRL